MCRPVETELVFHAGKPVRCVKVVKNLTTVGIRSEGQVVVVVKPELQGESEGTSHSREIAVGGS